MNAKVVDPEHNLPLLIEPEAGDSDPGDPLGAFARRHQEEVERRLLVHGAVLLRAFGVDTQEAFRRATGAFAGELLDYVDGNSPRTKLGSGIYTSTEYPAKYVISLHNELSYSPRWPLRLFFGCLVAPLAAGETVLASSRAILASLPAALVEEFRAKGVKYIRNLHGGSGLGPSWQDTFETADREAVARLCEQSGASYEWIGDGLRLSHLRPALARHPRTGEEVWFNQADQFHPSTHPPEVYAALMSLYGEREEDLPQNVRFGDDTPIAVAMLEEIRAVTRRHCVFFPWRQGDFLIVDNMLVSHGRAPFTGPRKILVAMSGPVTAGAQAG
jgi:alpha-ketoglutarate-dependent taurine dioxygenase